MWRGLLKVWLLNALGIVPLIVALCPFALAWTCAIDANELYWQGRYPRMLVSIAVGLSMLFCTVVLVALGAALLAYDAAPLIVRYAP